MSRVGERGKRSGGKRERTRAILIAAALDVVGEKGFTAASLEEIAKRAGMTRGAIYSNFAGRGELLLAAMGSKGLTLSSIRPVDSSLRAQLRAVADALIAALPRAQGESKFLAEFQLYALADPDLRRDIAAGYAAAFGEAANELAGRFGSKLAMAPKPLAVVIQSLALGLMCQYLLTPEEVSDEVVIAAFEALAAGVVETRR
ncbi:MAG TPA: TetR family transcriptional regulator [Caulobacteraceae bacterium]|nr:TetR family transcriptional regulator [Caulobacteraceae bacterium]